MRISEHAAGEAPARAGRGYPMQEPRDRSCAPFIAWPLRHLVASDAVARCAALQAWAMPLLRDPIL
jgi:hypothetical protein